MSGCGSEPPVACSLSAADVRRQVGAWQALLAHAVARTELDGGVRIELAEATPAGELMRLVAAEQSCCPFLAFAITLDQRGLALEVRAPGEALPIVHALFGEAPATD